MTEPTPPVPSAPPAGGQYPPTPGYQPAGHPAPGYPAAPYPGGPTYGYPRRNGPALAAMICGISAVAALLVFVLSLLANPFTLFTMTGLFVILGLIFAVGSILAVVLGHVGYAATRRGLPGAGSAITGLVLGYLGVLLLVIGIINNLTSSR